MKCKECKTKVKKNAEFCPYCGFKMEIKPKKESDLFVDINIILDKSGSMEMIKEETIRSFNNFILEQAQVEGRANISLYVFNHKYEIIYENINVKKVELLSKKKYITNGMTALLDAIGKTISFKSNHYESLSIKERPDKILFIIITDGEENSSKEYSKGNIVKLIENKKSQNWDFAFIGSGIDSFSDKSAGGLSFSKDSIMSVKAGGQGMTRGIRSLSGSTSMYRTSKGASFTFDTKNRS